MGDILKFMDDVIINSSFGSETKQRMLLIRCLVVEDDVLRSIQSLTTALCQDGLVTQEITELVLRYSQEAWEAMPYVDRYKFLRKIIWDAHGS